MAPLGDDGDAPSLAEAPRPDSRSFGSVGRLLLACALAISWLVSVPYMWKSVTTVPSAARLQAMQSRIVHVPSPTTFLRTTGQSFLELAVLVVLLWPTWRRFWLLRLVLAFLALLVWAVLTVPLELTELEWVHHRWLVGSDVVLLVAMLATVTARFMGAVQRARTRAAG